MTQIHPPTTTLLRHQDFDAQRISPNTARILPHPRTMPLQHAVTYQAFRKIYNFIRDNGDDWDEFCVNKHDPRHAETHNSHLPSQHTIEA